MSSHATSIPPPLPDAAGPAHKIHRMLRRTAELLDTDVRGLSRTLSESAWRLTLAWASLVVGGTLASFTLVHGLAALNPALPLWCWYGLVGLPVTALGAALLVSAGTKLTQLQPLDEHAVEIVCEMAQIAGQLSDTLESTTGTIKSTVESIRSATDLGQQVEKRPWAMFAGAASLGYVSGAILVARTPASRPPTPAAPERVGQENGPQGATPVRSGVREPDLVPREPGVLEKLGEVLAPQMELARQIAIGTIFSLVRDLARDAMPHPLEQPVDDFFNGAAKKFGGRPLARGTFKSPAPATTIDSSRPMT